ncbi:LINE-1 retrotransposable element ORF2 protein [Bienertia sinuspersici]
MSPKVNDNHANDLMLVVTNEEIRKAIFSIPGVKAPGPDGYNSSFFKPAWPIIGDEVCHVMKDFFLNGSMLRICTKLTLIPKASHPKFVTEFRPIACCNLLYKCITKIICNRIKKVLPDLISPNHSGFIEGRQIVHNVSIIQDLVGMYNRKASPPWCLLKIDIRKAYDSVQWDFLHKMLNALGFPHIFVGWVMSSVSTPTLTHTTNDSTHSFFKGKQGLRQGDPMSPLLFVICMEYLSRLLYYASSQDGYQFHYRCKTLKLNHLVLQMI